MIEIPATRAERIAALQALRPGEAALVRGLSAVFADQRTTGTAVTLIGRQPNDCASTFPSDVVTCRLDDGRKIRALCKYGRGRTHMSHGHRGDVAYEAAVYRHVIEPLRCSAPDFYGSYEPNVGETWLVIQFVDHAARVAHVKRLSLQLPARWIAQFHAANDARLERERLSFLKTYDADYYRQWAYRTATLTSDRHDRINWLQPLCEQFVGSVELLLDRPTVIHGEYTPKNILMQGDRVCPVDWESAAVGAGEIDLASLIDGNWPSAVVDECVREYMQTRWPEGPPSDFDAIFRLTQLYWNFRWLGERADWTVGKKGARRLENLRVLGEQMELI